MKIDGYKVKYKGIYDGYEAYFIDEYVTVGPVCYLVKDGEVTPVLAKNSLKYLITSLLSFLRMRKRKLTTRMSK